MKKHPIVYGWITMKAPVIVIVIGHDREMIQHCEGQAEAQAGRYVVMFKYDRTVITYPARPTFRHTTDHGNQINQFIKLVKNNNNPIPDCIFNDGNARAIVS